MKPSVIPLEKITGDLAPLYRMTIPEAYRDENGHMNVRWYLHIFDDAGYPMVASFGLDPTFHAQHGTGGFDLEQHLHYLKEVHIGDAVTVYARLIGRSAKRIHYMMFMVNETHHTLAALFECVNSFADLKERRTAAYPTEIAEKIDAILIQDRALNWDAPVCGVMSA